MLHFEFCLLKHGPLQALALPSCDKQQFPNVPAWEANSARTNATQAQHRRPGIDLHISVILKTTGRGVISASEPQRRRARNNRGFSQRSAFMNEATLGLEWAFVSLGPAVERVRANSPMRLGPWTRHGDAVARLRHESSPRLASPEACERRCCGKDKAKAGKGFVVLGAGPTSPIQAFTGKIFTNDSITELP